MITCSKVLIHDIILSFPADSLSLELVSVSGTNAAKHPYAKCFASFDLDIDSSCTLTITPKFGNNWISSLWSASATYTQYQACPTSASFGFSTSSAIGTGDLATLLASSIWPDTPVAAPTVTASDGILNVVADGATLKYRPVTRLAVGAVSSYIYVFDYVYLIISFIFAVLFSFYNFLTFFLLFLQNGFFSAVAVAGAPACGSTAGPGTGFATECSTSTTCGAGRRSVPITALNKAYVCALCPSGSFSTGGSTCTKVAAGKALESVGSTSDVSTACAAGTYSSSGSSDCRPCTAGTFQASTGQSTCNACPAGWNSHIPGSTKCVKCVDGRAVACATTNGASCDTNTATSGDFTATVPSTKFSAKATWSNTYGYPVMATCTTTNTLLSMSVSSTCVVTIQTLGVSAASATSSLSCSSPSNTEAVLTAYFTDATTISSKLTTKAGNIVKIVKGTAATALDVSIIAASTDPNKVPAGTVIVAETITVTGGQVAGAAAAAATCPGGSYRSGTAIGSLSCKACPVGQFCVADVTVTTDCPAGTANDILGRSVCVACDALYYAPDAGLTSCSLCSGTTNVEKTTCSTDMAVCGAGQNWDFSLNKCTCAPGYGYSLSGTTITCTKCTTNTYSKGGTDTCTACATGSNSAAGATACTTCGLGLSRNALGVCERCPAGTEPSSSGTGCAACAEKYYNPVDPTKTQYALYPICQRIPSGQKGNAAKTLVSDCGEGTYSAWIDTSNRVPAVGTDCATCPEGTVSPGNSKKCISCPGGTSASGGVCNRCNPGSFRPQFFSNDCSTCPIGTDTAGKKGASKCRNCSPGEFAKSEGAATCDQCGTNKYSSGPGSDSCETCAPGYDTDGEVGMSTCTACSAGFYNNAAGGSCLECDPGTYQDQAGKTSCKNCGIGFISEDPASEACIPCDAGA